ncbi:MAG TPA: hypothetical protein PK445_00045 [Methanolinea sp.]|nr:hypothetical protein [Methanolinea sp.]HOS81112.1 hypothetical protein [Methanolinea sp.]HPC54824.1 hypothetical protein [Methanolinea sp.]HQE84936.1 hypothetical protein [Methanolinea sp.]HQI13891.1 hypothetical protein [Methanolinea sp.]
MCRKVMCPACREANARVAMMRAYVRPRGPDGKLRMVPVGWWCPSCGGFRKE